ncbi:hypothetical protein [Spirosoma jeollabukense]
MGRVRFGRLIREAFLEIHWIKTRRNTNSIHEPAPGFNPVNQGSRTEPRD